MEIFVEILWKSCGSIWRSKLLTKNADSREGNCEQFFEREY